MFKVVPEFPVTQMFEVLLKIQRFSEENIARLQMAALSTSHRLSRFQIVLTKRLFFALSEIEFEFGCYSS